jgi:protein-S-isoprenylcysteine O-methyltransferase Ste14
MTVTKMPVSALAIYFVIAVLASVGRASLHHRRTGDFGVRGLRGQGVLAMAFGLTLAARRLLAAVFAPVSQIRGDALGRSVFESAAVNLCGLAVMIAGGVVIVAGQIQMGPSWRVGVDSKETTELVTSGLFATVRNPIFTGLLAVAAGLVLAVPNLIALVGFAATLLGVEQHVRAVEEPYMARVHGARYRSYASRVGRFLPGIGRLRSWH